MTAEPATGWRPRRILLAADHVEGLRDYVATRRPDLEWRAIPMQAMTPADLEWAEVYVGFRRPPLNGWGPVR